MWSVFFHSVLKVVTRENILNVKKKERDKRKREGKGEGNEEESYRRTKGLWGERERDN